MERKAVLSAVALLVCLSNATGQVKLSDATQDVLATNPEIIQLGIAQVTSKRWKPVPDMTVTERLKAGDRAKFYLVMTNTAPVPVVIRLWNTHLQNRPKLYRDSQLLPYKPSIAKILAAPGDPTSQSRTDSIRLEPNETRAVETVNLADWYDSLEPGHYELSISHRFRLGGKWIESPLITFEVDPK